MIPDGFPGTAIALPDVSRELGSDPAKLRGVVNGFNLALTISTLFWRWTGDRVGLRRTVAVGLATVLLGGGWSALAGSLASHGPSPT
ncbi:hypothetical protein KGD83_13735 [Nocardiopsis akebiae]|uniref:Major facilitator superfamily (MFS) profile domain-containing protein n=1 Tax=Nocardiopsis akebiae TaxID=2831968 RepID=A0ABX8CAL9_9ACTN|nr:hypothetical protein [Nocardiopsis akebiae]QUX31451.1 hypothetical protein KGD83_13735 [Nocardiopsis akebiae]